MVAEGGQRLVLRQKRDPLEVNRETGHENGQVQINAGERGEAERDGEKIQSLHARLSAHAGCAQDSTFDVSRS